MFKDQELTELRKELEVRELKIQQLQVKADSDPSSPLLPVYKILDILCCLLDIRRREAKIKLTLLSRQ